MNDSLWNLFRETGEPMSYLLCKAEERARQPERRPLPPQQRSKSKPAPAGPPAASD